jgi:hypothetical protein
MRLQHKIASFHLLVFAGLIEDLKKKYPNLSSSIDLFIKRDPTKKYLPYEVKTLASGQALENEIADVIDLFHRFRDRLDNKDINSYKFTELRDMLFDMRDFGGKSKNQEKKWLKEEMKKVQLSGAEKLYEDDQCDVIYVPDKATACVYGSGTKWCITMENERYYEDYANNNVVFYYIIRKDLPADDPMAKVAFACQRDENNNVFTKRGGIQVFDATDTQVIPNDAVQGLKNGNHILNLIANDASKRPMGFLAKLNFRPDELSFEDYAKNMNDDNKLLVAEQTNDPKIMHYLARSKDNKILVNLARNPYADAETLDKLADNEWARTYVAENFNTSPGTLARLANDAHGDVLDAVAKNPHTLPDTLRYLFENNNSDPHDSIHNIYFKLAENLSTPLDILEKLLAANYSNKYTNTIIHYLSLNPNFPKDKLNEAIYNIEAPILKERGNSRIKFRNNY